MSEQVAYVGDLVLDHGRSFETQTPGNHVHVFGQSHRSEHLRPEDARVTDFDPLLQLRVIAEHFERWLSVGIVSRLELQVVDSNLAEESLDQAHQVAEADVPVCDQAFALMELCQMSRIQRFVAENAINGEVLYWLELFLLRQFVEHLRADCCSVRSQDVLLCLRLLPIILVSL